MLRASSQTEAVITRIQFGRQVCGCLEDSASREWLITDGLGGYAMGTVAGLNTRRYHGLLVVATNPPGGRRLALASLDLVVVIGDRRVRLATHEWSSGAIDPKGYLLLDRFQLSDGVPSWQWSIGDVVIEAVLAVEHGRASMAMRYRLVRAPGPVGMEVTPLCTWRDIHGERYAGNDPQIERAPDGFIFEEAFRVRGPGYKPGGSWYRGVRHRAERERGLNDTEDLFSCGLFSKRLVAGEDMQVSAWAGEFDAAPPQAGSLIRAAQARARNLVSQSGAQDDADRLLVLAADQFVVAGPTVIAGYPWFGDWSRDTMTSYEGLLIATRRFDEGRLLLERAGRSLSEGMLANTADSGSNEYNTVDSALWFMQAVSRHVDATADRDLAAELVPGLESVMENYLAGTRFGITVDPSDGLVTQGSPGVALTWMDARVNGQPVTRRAGKPVEINALWINGLAALAALQRLVGRDDSRATAVLASATSSFAERFTAPIGLYDLVDGPYGNDDSLRPNQLLAASLPGVPVSAASIVQACAPLVTSLGLRSLSPDHSLYKGLHRGGPEGRDRAYHQGTVWPWLIGPYVDAALRAGESREALAPVLDGLTAHLWEWGLGSVSETADGHEPHDATGCPFQAWSVAELLRARALLR